MFLKIQDVHNSETSKISLKVMMISKLMEMVTA